MKESTNHIYHSFSKVISLNMKKINQEKRKNTGTDTRLFPIANYLS